MKKRKQMIVVKIILRTKLWNNENFLKLNIDEQQIVLQQKKILMQTQWNDHKLNKITV